MKRQKSCNSKQLKEFSNSFHNSVIFPIIPIFLLTPDKIVFFRHILEKIRDNCGSPNWLMSINTQGCLRPCCGDTDSVFYVLDRKHSICIKNNIRKKGQGQDKGKRKKYSYISDVLQAPFQTTEIKYLNKVSHTKFLISRCI